MLATSVIESNQERHVTSMDIPNAFVQTNVPQGDERIIMNFRGVLVDMLLDIYLENTKTSCLVKSKIKFCACTC